VPAWQRQCRPLWLRMLAALRWMTPPSSLYARRGPLLQCQPASLAAAVPATGHAMAEYACSTAGEPFLGPQPSQLPAQHAFKCSFEGSNLLLQLPNLMLLLLPLLLLLLVPKLSNLLLQLPHQLL